MDFGLEQKVAFITGSSAGIGRATAVGFAREGCRVAISYCHDLSGGEETAALVRENGADALIVRYDITNPLSIQNAANVILDTWGAIDILVNNAVHLVPHQQLTEEYAFERMPPMAWKPVFLNLEGAFFTIQSVLPSMRSRRWGRIVNVSSNLAEDGLAGASPYTAAKAGLHGLTASLAIELAPAGILVNSVLPGLTLTERTEKLRPKLLKDRMCSATPTGRLTMPEDIANTIVFLASSANGHINGEAIRITGGL